MTPEEFEQRRAWMGATDVSAILGVNPHTTAWEVSMEKRGLLDPDKGSKSTDAGTRCEVAVLDYAEDDLGVQLERNVRCWAPGGLPIASLLDARVPEGPPVECKTTGLVGPVYGKWGQPDTDEVPDVYLVQCTVQMFCTRSELAYLFALIGGRGFVRYQIHRDEEIIERIADTCCTWWDRHVVQGVEPERTEPVAVDVVKRLRRQPNKVIEFDDAATNAVAAWELAKERESSMRKAKDALQADILLRLGDAECARLQDGRELTYFQSERAGYEVAPTTVRTARVRKVT